MTTKRFEDPRSRHVAYTAEEFTSLQRALITLSADLAVINRAVPEAQLESFEGVVSSPSARSFLRLKELADLQTIAHQANRAALNRLYVAGLGEDAESVSLDRVSPQDFAGAMAVYKSANDVLNLVQAKLQRDIDPLATNVATLRGNEPTTLR